MTKIIRTICGIAIVALLFSIAYFFKSTPEQPDFAPGTNIRVFLPEAGSKQKVRYERYYADRETRELTDIEYLDGSSEQIFYSQDNVRVAATQYFAPNENDVKQLKSRATYDLRRGQYFTSHLVYRLDGSLERSGVLLSDGRYQTRYYFADNTLARERLFDQNRAFISETLFSLDGTVSARIVQTQPDQKEVSLYFPSGARRGTYSLNIAGGANGSYFAEDGSITSEFSKTYWNSSETYFTAAGKVWQQRLSYSNNLSIRLLNQDGVVTTQQVWRLRPPNGEKAAYKMLASVSVFKPGVLRPYRTINMDRSGQYVESITNVSAAGTVTKTLNQDGVVLKVQTRENNGYYSGAPRTAEEAAETVDPALLMEPVSNPLPELQDRDSPRLEYDYD